MDESEFDSLVELLGVDVVFELIGSKMQDWSEYALSQLQVAGLVDASQSALTRQGHLFLDAYKSFMGNSDE